MNRRLKARSAGALRQILLVRPSCPTSGAACDLLTQILCRDVAVRCCAIADELVRLSLQRACGACQRFSFCAALNPYQPLACPREFEIVKTRAETSVWVS